MKEFIDKLISRLEEEHERCINRYGIVGGNAPAMEVKQCMDIVNQLAEEYKDKVMFDGQYCWQTCSATEHCKECNRLCNGSIDYYENYDFMAEEYKGGWIACSERLPEVEADVLLSLRSLDVYTGFRANTEGCFYVEGEGYVVFENILAWMPLPAPYTEGE